MEKSVLLQKQKEVEDLSAKLSAAKSVVAFDYVGLTVDDFTVLRRQLRAAGCDVKIYKNNIARRASEKAGVGALAQYLVGPKAIAISNTDVIAAAKVVYEFGKTNDKVSIEAGVVEGEVYDQAKMNEVASLPSFDTLLTMLAAGMLAPVRDLTIGLHMMTEKE